LAIVVVVLWSDCFSPILCRNAEGARVVVVDDIQNPYRHQRDFDMRFMFTLNKIYAWSLTEYQRVVMLDVDNLFLRAPDELFQCGQFCAAFINPCIFHTGLFVLQASCSLRCFSLPGLQISVVAFEKPIAVFPDPVLCHPLVYGP
jgi:hypothetical protein